MRGLQTDTSHTSVALDMGLQMSHKQSDQHPIPYEGHLACLYSALQCSWGDQDACLVSPQIYKQRLRGAKHTSVASDPRPCNVFESDRSVSIKNGTHL